MNGSRLGLAVILLANGIALLGVARNRSGTPVQSVEFSQHELRLMPTVRDDSSVRLRLEWAFPRSAEGTYPGFDEAKLRELGFDLPLLPDDGSTLPREAFIAFRIRQTEENSPTQETPSGRPAQNPDGSPVYAGPRAPRHTSSRLIVVDAARSYAELRGRYPDPRKHPILRGVVYAHRLHGPGRPGSAETVPLSWQGHVSALVPSEIHVPLPYSATLAPLKELAPELRRYSVTLHYGRNLEPWVAGVERR